MSIKRSIVIAAILLVGIADQSFGHPGVVVEVPIPVPVVTVGVPVAVAPVPFFFEGFWWWNNGGYWHRSQYEHGPWGHPYRGRVPGGVIRYHNEHFGNRGGHDDHRGHYDHDHR